MTTIPKVQLVDANGNPSAPSGGTVDITTLAKTSDISSLAGRFPTSVGPKASSGAFPVVPAPDYVPPLSPLQAQEARTAADDAAYYATARDGSASTRIQLSTLAAGIKTLEVVAIGSNVWFKLGGSSVTAATPTTDATSGMPRYLPQGSSILLSVGASTHLSLNGTGISVAWWLT